MDHKRSAVGEGFYAQDPRSSSTQSLVSAASDAERGSRRTLLIIYVHGFMGNDTSFQSFPAHVHRYLRLALSDTHVIHSKIYPRYKTYKAIEVARDNFSQWLEPHESPDTDVILVGHSMGGLLAAEVILMPSPDPRRYFKHRILGAIHLDAPLLGLHPGIISSGLASLFRPKPEKPGPSAQTPDASGTASPSPSYSDASQPTPSITPTLGGIFPALTFDPNFNPSFTNDVHLKDRGWRKNIAHFVKKHRTEGLMDAATNHIMSHLEFGSCLVDWNCLKTRYKSVRALEDMDDLQNRGFPHVAPQVRFVQFYTVCHGYPKKPKTPAGGQNPADPAHGAHESTPHIEAGSSTISSPAQISLDSASIDTRMTALDINQERPSPEVRAPSETKPPANGTTNIEAGITGPPSIGESATSTAVVNDGGGPDSDLHLAPIPSLPPKPELPDLDGITDKEERKRAEKDSKQAQKAYDQAVKSRDKAIKEQQKMLMKRQRKLAEELQKQAKEEQKRLAKEQKQQEQQKKEQPAPPPPQSEEEVEDDGAEADMIHIAPQPIDELATDNGDQGCITPDVSSSSLATHAKPNAPADTAPDATSEAHRPASITSTTSTAPPPYTPFAQEEGVIGGGVGESSSLITSTTTTTTSTVDSSAPASGGGVAAAVAAAAPTDPSSSPSTSSSPPAKPLKDRKFILQPERALGGFPGPSSAAAASSSKNDAPDPRWVRVFMRDMDETAAHTSLFFPGEHYEKLVGEVGTTVVGWVHEDATKRMVIQMDQQG